MLPHSAKIKFAFSMFFIVWTFFYQTQNAFSQPSFEWKSIFSNGTSDNHFSDMCLDTSGNTYVAYIAAGYALRKISPTGGFMWEREYSAGLSRSSVPKFVRYDPKGYIYISGQDFGIVTLKYDLNGNLIWVERYDDGILGHELGGMVLDGEGNCYIGIGHWGGGISNKKHFTIIKYDSSGDSVWVQRIYGSQYDGRLADIILDKDNNIIVTGVSNDLTLHPTNNIRTVKLNNNNGDVIWNKFYFKPDIWNSGYSQALGVDKNNNVYVGATLDIPNKNAAYLLKYSQNGNLIWTSQYYNSDSLCNLRDMITDSIGACYMTGYETYRDSTSEDFFTVKFDSSGNLKWNQTYSSGFIQAADIPDRITLDKFNNVYVIGSEEKLFFDTISISHRNICAIKYDNDGDQKWIVRYYNDSLKYSLGNSLCLDRNLNVIIGGIGLEGRGVYPNRNIDVTVLKYSQTNSIHNNSSNILSDYKLFQNFPNPFNPTTNIKFQLKTPGHVTVKIFDISGKNISNLVNRKLESGEHKISWNAGNNSSGIYFYTLYVNDMLINSKKMILLK